MKKNKVKVIITKKNKYLYSVQIEPEIKNFKELKKTGGHRIIELLGEDPYSNDVKIALDYLGAGLEFLGNVHTKCGSLLETAIIRTFSKNFKEFHYDKSKGKFAGDAFPLDKDFNGLPDFFCNDTFILGEIKTAGIAKKVMNWKNGGYTKFIGKNSDGSWNTVLCPPKNYLIQLFLMKDLADKYFPIKPVSCVLITVFVKDKEFIVSELEKFTDKQKEQREKRADELVKDLDFHTRFFKNLPKNWEDIKKTALKKRDEILTVKENKLNVEIPINNKTIQFIEELKKADHIELIINRKEIKEDELEDL